MVAWMVGLTVMSGVAVAGCGVTTESQPHAFQTTRPVTVAPPSGRATRLTDIYFLRQDHLSVVQRPVPDPVTLQRVIQALLKGPTASEGARGVRSALPTTLMVKNLTARGETAVIDLGDGFAAIDSADQALAIAQLVYTVTGWPGIDRLRVMVDGKAVQVPRADGQLTDGDVTRADYASLLPS
jgi:spore germination protein GerM